MKTKRLALAYADALKAHGLSQAEFARRNGLVPPELTRMRQGTYPNPALLLALVTGWPDGKTTGLRLLRAHLQDECERAGVGEEELVVQFDRPLPADAVEAAVRDLELFIRRNPELVPGLCRLAVLVKGEVAAERLDEVAEPKPGDPPVVVPSEADWQVSQGRGGRRKLKKARPRDRY